MARPCSSVSTADVDVGTTAWAAVDSPPPTAMMDEIARVSRECWVRIYFLLIERMVALVRDLPWAADQNRGFGRRLSAVGRGRSMPSSQSSEKRPPPRQRIGSSRPAQLRWVGQASG